MERVGQEQRRAGSGHPRSRGPCTATAAAELIGTEPRGAGLGARRPEEPERAPRGSRGPAAPGQAGAAEAEAGAAGARWGCLKEIYNHFLSVVW